MADGLEYVELKDFKFQDGTVLPRVKVAYKQTNTESKKVALIPTCYGGKVLSTPNFSDAALKDYRIIVVAMFGNGESTSPSNDPDCPKSLDYRDSITGQYRMVTEHFGLKSLDVVVGFSMGGQQAFYWPTMYPDFVKNAVAICGSAKTSRHNRQFLEGPRAALEYSVDYVIKDRAPPRGTATEGMKAFGLAYSAWLTSYEWFEKELYKEIGFETQEAWSRNEAEDHGDWTPEDYLILLKQWQKGDISTCVPSSNGDLGAALATIKARMLVMPCQTDQYFTPQPSEYEVKHLKHGTLRVIPSIWGHIAMVNPVDVKFINEEMSKFLESA